MIQYSYEKQGIVYSEYTPRGYFERSGAGVTAGKGDLEKKYDTRSRP